MTSPLLIDWSPRAGRDLEAIHDHIAAERPNVAAEMKRRLVEAADGLADFPSRDAKPGARASL